MRYKIFGMFENGLSFTEHCDSRYLGNRIIQLQDIGIEILSVSKVEVYGSNDKSYGWTVSSFISSMWRDCE
jgi:hypothetical protein